MAVLIAVTNQKGGCGKTTTTMNLAGGLVLSQYRVLVVDADPQASATVWSLAHGQTLPFDVLTLKQAKNPRTLVASPDYDIVLVDCPPGVAHDPHDQIRAVMLHADAILVPLRPSTLDFSAAATFVRSLLQYKRPETQTLVLLNAVQMRTSLSRQAREQAALLFCAVPGAAILETTIGLRAPVTEVSGSGRTIFDYAPRSEAAREYTALTKEIIQWLTAHPSQPSNSPKSSPRPTDPSPAASRTR